MPRLSQLDSFRCRVNKRFCLELKTYQDLHHWSVENIAAFWAEFWDFSGLLYSQPYTQVLPEKAGIADIPEWFKGSRLNFAENLLRCQDNQQIALYATGEQRDKIETVTFGELKRRVGKMAAAMREMGLKPGDVVAGYLPNCVLAVVAMLATATVGAIWTCTSPEFGVEAVLSRFSQLSPHLLLSVDCVIYNRKSYSQLDKVKHISKALPSLQRVVITPYVEARENIDISEIPHSMFIEDFNALGKDREIVNGEGNGVEETADVELTFEQLPFSCPLLIAFTSGTTGAPKGLVHSVGGVLIKQMEEHLLQGELGAGDLMCFYTTTGWMMWNWLIAAISVGASVLLYDGSPLVPSPSALLDLVDQLGVSVLGVSPKLLSLLEDDGHRPMQTHKLQSLHTILSTGSVLPARSFNYVYNEVKSDVQLVSISGGTDIMGCFVGPCPGLHPLPGEIPGPLLGMAIESWDEDGRRLFGESGELVCTQPFPSQPLYFWGDDLGKKYHQAYFSKFKGIWAHGDYCKINPESGGLVLLGRSDGTLNPNGVRFGSTEIYNIVEAFPEILDSLCVAQRGERGEERAVLFLKPSPGYKLNLELCTKLRQAIRNSLSPRHVPAVLLEIKDIPYTVSGKKVENAVRRVIEGEKPRLLGTLTNPESLSLFYNLPELHGY